MEETIIYQKSSKQLKLIILSFIMLGMCIAITVMGIVQTKVLFIVIGLLTTLFFGLCFAYILYRFIKPGEVLIINSAGITDKSSAGSAGFIAWEEIEKFYIGDVMSNKFIMVKVKDTEKLFSRLPAWKVKLLKANIKLGYEAAAITLQTADADLEEVLSLLMSRLQIYNQSIRMGSPANINNNDNA